VYLISARVSVLRSSSWHVEELNSTIDIDRMLRTGWVLSLGDEKTGLKKNRLCAKVDEFTLTTQNNLDTRQ